LLLLIGFEVLGFEAHFEVLGFEVLGFGVLFLQDTGQGATM
jgi:hypothetical protein